MSPRKEKNDLPQELFDEIARFDLRTITVTASPDPAATDYCILSSTVSLLCLIP